MKILKTDFWSMSLETGKDMSTGVMNAAEPIWDCLDGSTIGRTDIDLSVKKCSKCNTPQPATNFHKDKRTKTGLQAQCKDCQAWKNRSEFARKKHNISCYMSAVKWREENLERYRTYQREYQRKKKYRERKNEVN